MNPIRSGDVRRAYILTHPAIFLIALGSGVSGILWLLIPSALATSPIATSDGLVELLWAAALAVGSWTVVAAFCRAPRGARCEVAGLLLIAACYLGYGVAILIERSTGRVSASLFFIVAAACFGRAIALRFEPEIVPWNRRTRF